MWISARTYSGMSSRSGSLRRGTMTSVRPARWAASGWQQLSTHRHASRPPSGRVHGVTVFDFWCAADCGVQIQPDNMVAQIEDGIVYQTNFSDYPVPRMRDTPAMHVELIPSDNPPVGVGQTSVPLVAPAIGNAVAQLTDIRLRQLPMSPERVKTALG